MKRINEYFFPVETRPVYVGDTRDPVVGYKAVVAHKGNTESTVAVVKDTYKLVTNRELIEPFLEQIQSLKQRWYIDTSHSFVLQNRMRLQITFPDVYISDTESMIPLSVYLHNSYDASEGVRFFWGAIRAICTNGMIFGEVLGKYYARHTSGIDLRTLSGQFSGVTDKLVTIEKQIKTLDEIPVDEDTMLKVQRALGKRRLEQICTTDVVPDKSMWQLYNDCTYLLSHTVEKSSRADLQQKIALAFGL